MWEIILWIVLILAVFIIGMAAVFKWAFRKGRKGYTKIKERRDERKK